MPNWNHIVRQHLAVLRLPPEREVEIVEELAQHLEAAYEDALASGLSEMEAEARAVQSYDWRLLECELSRAEQSLAARAWRPSLDLIERKGGMRMESLLHDLRFGMRMLLKSPGFTAVAALSLVLGIGANTAIFSLIDKVMIKKAPVEEPDRLVVVSVDSGRGLGTVFTYPDFADYRAQNEVFEGLVCYAQRALTLNDGGQAERIQGTIVSGNYFTALRVQPALGRGFLPEEDKTRGSHPVVVLSYGLWQRRFSADPGLVGKAVNLNGVKFTVVGVAPPEFTGTVPGIAPDVYVPVMMQGQVSPSWKFDPLTALRSE